MTQVWICSNKECGAVWDRDPEGHCPACCGWSNGERTAGWSTMGRTVRNVSLAMRGENPNREPSFFVIERYRHDTLTYWRPGLQTQDGWTQKIEEAIWFSNPDSASHVLSRLCADNGRVVEHMMVSP